MTGHEEQFLARTEVLDDTGEIAQAVTAVLAGAQAAGVDPAAASSLAAAARTLDPAAGAGYNPGSKNDRHPGGGYRSDGEFLEAVSHVEGDVQDRLREVQQLRECISAAAESARDDLAQARLALAAAYALPVKDQCDGCHGIKQAAIMAAESAIADAQRRIGLCDTAAEILDPLTQRLTVALSRLQQVPQDLGEIYELVYAFIRTGGKLPAYARWIEGDTARLPARLSQCFTPLDACIFPHRERSSRMPRTLAQPPAAPTAGEEPALHACVWDHVARTVAWLAAANGRGPHEMAVRVMKIAEEAGEAVAAYIAAIGANPRKGITGGPDQLAGELCDVVLAALIALTTITGGTPQAESALAAHVAARSVRLRALQAAA